MKKVAGSLRLDLAAFRDLEAFAQLGTELDAATQRQLDRGQRMVELLKQGQYRPYHVADQVISIFAGGQGFCDDIRLSRVRDFEEGLLKHIRDQHAAMRVIRTVFSACRATPRTSAARKSSPTGTPSLRSAASTSGYPGAR